MAGPPGRQLADRHRGAIHLRGRITPASAMETAAAAGRHGWREVEVWGDRAYKDEVTIACRLRGITVTTHHFNRKASRRAGIIGTTGLKFRGVPTPKGEETRTT